MIRMRVNLNFCYRCGRRGIREFRKRGGGLDVAFDHWLYRIRHGPLPGRGRILKWAAMAPWGERLPARGESSEWVTDEESLALIAAADRACAQEFDLLGSGLVRLGEQIDWHCDFKSGHRWDAALPHGRIRWDNVPAGADVKVPWELSRCLHFAALGLADWFTGDARYYAEWKAQVRHWMAANAVGRGVNWACAMDVGMRAVNWLNAAWLFRERIEQDDDPAFFGAFAESLWHHGLHVERNLEWSGPGGRLAGNHFLANLVGLLAIGAFFRDTSKGRQWWSFAKRWLEEEMLRQVNADGTNYETSTSYHRMVMEMFLWSDTIAERSGEPFSECYHERFDRMGEFVASYSAPGGTAAQFGDNDSGRLMAAGVDDGMDHRYLTPGKCGFGGRLNRLLLRGTLRLPGGRSPTPSSFPAGGFHFIRRDAVWVGLRAGPVSHGGAHAHCDQMSFVLSVGGRDIFVDRGTGVYTPDPDQRNRYRATAAHNVCQINDWEQNGFGRARGDVFRMPDHTRARVIRVADDPRGAEWEAEHRGFERHRAGLRCRRKVGVTAQQVAIQDHFDHLRAGDRLEWRFHLAPGLQGECATDGMRVTAPGLRVLLAWDFAAVAAIEPVHHSPAYGVETPAEVLRLRAVVESPGLSYRFLISWGGADSGKL